MNALETHVLEMIAENTTTPDVFTDTDSGMAPIRDSLNDAIEEISFLTGAHKVVYQLPLIADQSFYRIRTGSASVGWITDAWLVNEKRRLRATDVLRLTAENPRWFENAGSPWWYFPVGVDVLGIAPRPSGTSDLLELTMVLIPARYTSGTDRVKLRDDFKWAAVHYAVSEYYAGRGDAKSAIDHHKRYLDQLGLQKLYSKNAERAPFYRTQKQQ